jgi:hypothetical protein
MVPDNHYCTSIKREILYVSICRGDSAIDANTITRRTLVRSLPHPVVRNEQLHTFLVRIPEQLKRSLTLKAGPLLFHVPLNVKKCQMKLIDVRVSITPKIPPLSRIVFAKSAPKPSHKYVPRLRDVTHNGIIVTDPHSTSNQSVSQ